jgi:trehalose-6-phosphate synthase
MTGYRFIVVANREPFIHRFSGDQITVIKPASGLVAAIDPIMDSSRGTWIAHGSARELTDAIQVNPFAVQELADAMCQAVTMPPDERKRRMQRMRDHLEQHNVYRWGGKVLSELLKFDFPENT